MARPRSEEKQAALLEAAAKIVAAEGVGARTASIAKLSGVAEGTLFRYFATKDVLFNELYLHVKRDLADAMRVRLAKGAALEAQVRALWDGYIEWGVAHPDAVLALKQLSIAENVTAATRAKAALILPEVGEVAKALAARSAAAGRPAEFTDAIFMALADTTIQFAAREPRQASAFRAAGFKVLWEGLTR